MSDRIKLTVNMVVSAYCMYMMASHKGEKLDSVPFFCPAPPLYLYAYGVLGRTL